MTNAMFTELADALRNPGAARPRAGRGSLPSTVNILGAITTALGTVLSSVLEPRATPSRSPHGFTIVDRSLTRC
ncbi:MAG: hypothetical protein ABW001_07915 [Mycobacterium sp.]